MSIKSNKKVKNAPYLYSLRWKIDYGAITISFADRLHTPIYEWLIGDFSLIVQLLDKSVGGLMVAPEVG